MTKQCTCKKGKKDPKCPSCAGKNINLDSFHKLNPEAKPKTAEQFKLGMDALNMPKPATKHASVEQFKLAYGDPYGRPPEAMYYGQYGRDPRDEGLSGFDKALLLGGGTALAGGLHHTLMNSRGGVARGYQKGIGGSIRSGANTVREHLGMDPVAQPPHPVVGRIQDAAASAAGAAKGLYGKGKAVLPIATGALGAAATAKMLHDKMMAEQSNIGQIYRNTVGPTVESASNKVVGAGRRAAGWVADKTAPAPSVLGMKSDKDFEKLMGTRGGSKQKRSPEDVKARVQPKIKKAPTQSPPGPGAWTATKKGSMIYESGADAALATYLR